MLNALFQFKFCLEQITETSQQNRRSLLSKIVLNGLKLVDTYIIYFYLLIRKFLGLICVTPLIDDESRPIVALTSFPARLGNLWMVLFCIFRQTVKPGKIIVTLINDEIPGGFDSLPISLKRFANKGVVFLFENENLKPHNKYIYAREKNRNRIIITIDDDLLYYPDTIERLMLMHAKYPNAVCTNRSHRLEFSGNSLKSYQQWKNVFLCEGPSSYLIALGYSAVLYPKSFNHPDLYCKEKIKRLSLGADDIWLLVMEILSRTPVVVGSYYAHPVTLPFSQKIALQATNNGLESKNDYYLDLLNREYNFESFLRKNV